MTNKTKDNAGVIAPPPLIYLWAIVIGLALNYFYPAAIVFFPRLFVIIAGIILIISAALLIVLSLRRFTAAKTNVEPWKPTTAIISSGVYGFSRNPIYLAMTLLYLGAALLLDSMWVLILVVPVLFLIHFGVILREEKYLAAKFGEEYISYKMRVRRWI